MKRDDLRRAFTEDDEFMGRLRGEGGEDPELEGMGFRLHIDLPPGFLDDDETSPPAPEKKPD